MKRMFVAFIVGGLTGAALIWGFADHESSAADKKDAERWRERGYHVSQREEGERTGRSLARGTRVDGRGEISLGDYLEYLNELVKVRDDNEVNFMKIARYAGQIAHMSEAEARDLIQAMENFEIDEESENDDLRNMVTALAFIRWCELSGPDAMNHLTTATSPLFKELNKNEEIVHAGMVAWTEADPEGARRWFSGLVGEVDQMEFSDEKPPKLEGAAVLLNDRELYDAFLKSYIKAEGGKALEMTAGWENEKVNQEMRNSVIKAMAEKEESPVELKKLLAKTEAEDVSAQKVIYKKLVKKDLPEARKLVEQGAPSKENDNLIRIVAGEWLSQEPEQASAWYLKQNFVTPGQESDRLTMIFNHWGNQDLAAADQWLASQPNDPTREAAEAMAVRYYSGRKDYQGAMKWIAEIDDGELRTQNFNRVLNRARNRKTQELPEALIEAAKAAGFEESLPE